METCGSAEKWWLISTDDDTSCSVKPLFFLEGDTVRTSADLISEVLFEDRDLRLAIILLKRRFVHLRGMRIVYGRYEGVWALACLGTTPLLQPDVLVCADQYEHVVQRLLLDLGQSYPDVKYFDVLARDEHKRAIINRYPDTAVQLRSLQAENVILKETVAVHDTQQVMLLEDLQAENKSLKGRMAQRTVLAQSLEEGCRCLRDI